MTGDSATIQMRYYHTSTSTSITATFNIDFKENCLLDRKINVLYSGVWGGINNIIFANKTDTIIQNSNKFTLEGGRKIQLNEKRRNTGQLITEYIIDDNEGFITQLFLAKNVWIVEGYYADVITSETLPILKEVIISNPTHKIQKINNKKMVQYTFNYEEVERLKY